MKTIIIDSDDYIRSGIQTHWFSGGEPHCEVPNFKVQADQGESVRVIFWGKLRTWADVGMAACVLDVLGQQWAAAWNLELDVLIPYFPGARADKMDEVHPTTASRMASLLLSGDLPPVRVFDIHSQEALEWCNTEVVTRNFLPDILPAHYFHRGAPELIKGIIAPDKGAWNRAKSVRDMFAPHAPIVECMKERDQNTGRITKYAAPLLKEPGRYIVVDDVCDGGATFNMLAEAFAEDGIAQESTFELYVSHGIFSKGLDNIDPMYKAITTTDSWCTLKGSTRLVVAPLMAALSGAATND